MSKITFPGGGAGGGGGGGGGGVTQINGVSGSLTLSGASGIAVSNNGTTFSFDGASLLPIDGSRAADQLTVNGFVDITSTLAVSGASQFGAELLPSSSGTIALGGSNIAWSEVWADTVRGLTVSGTNSVGAPQMYISGIAVGDFLSTAGGSDGSGIGSVFASGAKISPSELTIYGSGSVVVTTGDASSIIISGGGGGGSVDLSAVAQDIVPDSSGTRNIGQLAKPWNSGFFNRVVVYSPNGSGWYIDVDNDGVLQTTGPYQP